MDIFKQRKHNWVAEFQIEKIRNAHSSGLTYKCYDDSISRFNLFHILNHIMYSYSLRAIDEMEEAGLLRFAIKHYWNECEKTFKKYDGKMKTHMQYDAWCLMQDYIIAAEKSIDAKLTTLEICLKNYMDKLGCENTDILAKLAVAIRLGEIINEWFRIYFQTYKELCGIDFSSDFKYAKMDTFLFNMLRIFDGSSKNNPMVDFGKDSDCVKATHVLQKELAEDKFLDDAAVVALSLSEKYKPMYEKMKKESEKKV